MSGKEGSSRFPKDTPITAKAKRLFAEGERREHVRAHVESMLRRSIAEDPERTQVQQLLGSRAFKEGRTRQEIINNYPEPTPQQRRVAQKEASTIAADLRVMRGIRR